MRTLMVLVLVVVSAPVWAQANRPQTPVGPFPCTLIGIYPQVLTQDR